MVPELAKALSVLPDRIKAYTLQSTQARRLQENAIDTSGLS